MLAAASLHGRSHFVPEEILVHCNLSTDSRKSSGVLPALAFVKTHKTGGSTVSDILNRIADARSLSKLCPSDYVHLGWPGVFPGEIQNIDSALHDVINNHAILNRTRMEAYLKRPAFFFTILRGPVVQAISAFNYFGYARQSSWAAHLAWLGTHHSHEASARAARLQNSQASDLGWYEYASREGVGGDSRAAPRSSAAAINRFVRRLDADLDVALLLEEIDAGLVLLAHRLGLSLPEVAYVPRKTEHATPYVTPTPAQERDLRALLAADVAMYAFFKQRWRALWAEQTSRHPELLQRVSELRCLNARLARRSVPRQFGLDSIPYTRYLCEKRAGQEHGPPRIRESEEK